MYSDMACRVTGGHLHLLYDDPCHVYFLGNRTKSEINKHQSDQLGVIEALFVASRPLTDLQPSIVRWTPSLRPLSCIGCLFQSPEPEGGVCLRSGVCLRDSHLISVWRRSVYTNTGNLSADGLLPV